MIFISFVVPIYNKEKELRRLISCFEAQTSDNFEVIYIDDGSLDHSLQILNKGLVDLKHKHKVITKKNEGVSKTRNLGIKESKGKYIFFLDADDIIIETTVEVLETKLKLDKDIIWFGFNRGELINGKVINKFNYLDKYIYKKFKVSTEALDSILSNEIKLIVSSYIIKKSKLMSECVYFNENLKNFEDILFLYEILDKKLSIDCLNIELTTYLDIENSTSKQFDFKTLDNLSELLNCLKRLKKQDHIFNEINKVLKTYVKNGKQNYNKEIKNKIFKEWNYFLTIIQKIYFLILIYNRKVIQKLVILKERKNKIG